MKAVLSTLVSYLKRIHWKRVLSVSGGTFLGGAGLYLASHINPTDTLTFAKLGHQLEGAAAYGLIPTVPVLGGMLINSVQDKRSTVSDADGEDGEDEEDPLDESRDIDPEVALPPVPVVPVQALAPTARPARSRAKKAS